MPVTSDFSPQLSGGRYQTPFTSSPLPAMSKELPRSARSKHAATFDLKSMEAMTSGSRKRRRRNTTMEWSSKAPRISWETSLDFPQSSPTVGRARPRRADRENPNSFVSETDTIPDEEVHSPNYQHHSDDTEVDPEVPDLPRTEQPDLPNMVSSSIVSSSPPRTPSPNRSRLAGNNKAVHSTQGGADLLLYLANSPTPARLGGAGGGGGKQPGAPDFLPSTPPTQHAVLPSFVSTPGGAVTTNFGTPSQGFNLADFLNVTPSPAQAQWASRTPRSAPKTPVGGKEVRKRLNFDTLAPPTGCSPASKSPEKRPGIALQLGEELRP